MIVFSSAVPTNSGMAIAIFQEMHVFYWYVDVSALGSVINLYHWVAPGACHCSSIRRPAAQAGLQPERILPPTHASQPQLQPPISPADPAPPLSPCRWPSTADRCSRPAWSSFTSKFQPGWPAWASSRSILPTQLALQRCLKLTQLHREISCMQPPLLPAA